MAKVTTEAAAIVKVLIPSPLRSYTGGAAQVHVAVLVLAPEHPPTLSGVLSALERAHRGLRFRIADEQGAVRPHIRMFVARELARNLATPVPRDHDVMIAMTPCGGEE